MESTSGTNQRQWAWAICLFLFLVPAAWAAAPRIESARVSNGQLIVTADVPSGAVKAVLESRTRIGAGAWVPRQVVRLTNNADTVLFDVPMSSRLELLRVRVDDSDPLPAFFYGGTNQFNGQASSSDPGAVGVGGGALNPSANPTGSPSPGQPAQSRSVVESDIWELNGSTLYFFNQYRGLQVIDVSQPDAPKITGQLTLPAAGEQMYLLDSAHVVLLASDGCGWSPSGPQSQALVVEIKSGAPSIIATVPVSGTIQESRMVGTALYIASQAYRQSANSASGGPSNGGGASMTWEWGTVVSSYDLADPSHPAARNSFWFSGYGNAVMATDQYLFVATTSPMNWWQSLIQVIDISAPDGTMQPVSKITAAGQVPDKFKMNLDGQTFTAISQAESSSSRWVTTLETFSLATPTAPAKLGSLQLAAGDQLHATRFDGDRVYIVTFYQRDPLWVVDLSDPAHPKIAGQVQVPGWSTYIEPLGDGRLVTVGISNTNDWRVAVSLFDVSNPAQPALLAKVPLGQNFSWSEATSDEKAFNVIADAGLILVPYEGDSTNGWASQVQLIDLGQSTLTLRGIIHHAFQPRRTAFQNNVIFSISGHELLTVDAQDRDHPKAEADLALAWPVDQLFLKGDYLLEVATGTAWNNQLQPVVRVGQASAPDQIVGEFDLTNRLPILAAAVHNGFLFVAQGQSWGGGPIWYGYGADNSPVQTNLVVSVLDLGNLPQLKLVGSAIAPNDGRGFGNSLHALFPRDGLLVLAGGSTGWFLPMAGAVGGAPTPTAASSGAGTNSASGSGAASSSGSVAGPSGGAVSSGVMTPVDGPVPFWPPWFRWGGGRLWAFDVQTPSQPQFVSSVDLTTNQWWSFSSAFAVNGTIYMSHQNSRFLPGVLLPGQTPPAPTVTYDKGSGQWITNQPPIGIWVQQYYLDVVDYADAKNPTVHAPVNIPGTLNGVSHSGALLYTIGNHWDAKWNTDWTEYLDASAFDGVTASLVDSLPLPAVWPHPTLISGDTILLGRPGDTNSPNLIQVWSLGASGKFAEVSEVKTPEAIQNLGIYGASSGLLAAQTSQGVELWDARDTTSLKADGQGATEGCVWFDLQKADGDITRGLWLPLGDYGVEFVPVANP